MTIDDLRKAFGNNEKIECRMYTICDRDGVKFDDRWMDFDGMQDCAERTFMGDPKKSDGTWFYRLEGKPETEVRVDDKDGDHFGHGF